MTPVPPPLPLLTRRAALGGLLAAGSGAALPALAAAPRRPGFRDALADGLPEHLEADLCIVGAGAAGITLARALAGTPLRILLLESGGLTLDGATQALYRAPQTGLPYYDLTACRLRYFGGTSNHWGGYCRPNDPIDYAGRPELGVPAWPLDHMDLAPWIARAATALGLTMEGFEPRLQLQARGMSDEGLVDRTSALLTTKVFQIAQRIRFAQLHRQELEEQENLSVLLHANVTGIGLSADGQRVERLAVRTLAGGEAEVRATRVVLACHAIENARLLLASDDVRPEGIGNAHGHVGRYFMEHAQVTAGVLVPAPDGFPPLYDFGHMSAHHVNANLGLSERAMRQRGVLQYYCRFRPPEEHEALRAAMGRVRDGLARPLDTEGWPDLMEDVGDVLADLPDAAEVLWRTWSPPAGDARYYVLDHRIEQAPNPDSRVTLTDRRDALGNRQPALHWALSDLDFRTFREGAAAVAAEMARLGFGEVRLDPLTPERIAAQVRGHYHHIGTTRMSSRPEDGVVDASLRVHGVENLYVAGSSVFPTAGYSGPTMTLIALTLRLAEHLRRTTHT